MDWLKYLQKPDYWLLALLSAIASLHLIILDRSEQPNLMSISILFWLAIASLLWDKRKTLNLESDPISTIIGFLLIALVLIRSVSPAGYHLLISPFLCSVGLCLIASGFKGIRQYWKELLILSLLLFHSVFASFLQAINLSLLTAKFSTLLLWMSGFEVAREGVFIALPTGKVEVYGACSGVESIILMFSIAILFFLIIPINNIQKIICLTIAIFLGFFINCLRVAIMTVLVSYSNKESFDYWHGDDGGLIFSMAAVFIFGVCCWFIYVRPLTVAANAKE